MNTRTYTKVTTHDTPPELFASLARVFPVEERDGTRWITFKSSDGVDLTFFAVDAGEVAA